MSYSLESNCHVCTKKDTCADGAMIQCAINCIHQIPGGSADSCHQGSGVIRHDCSNFVKKEG